MSSVLATGTTCSGLRSPAVMARYWARPTSGSLSYIGGMSEDCAMASSAAMCWSTGTGGSPVRGGRTGGAGELGSAAVHEAVVEVGVGEDRPLLAVLLVVRP